MKRSPHRPGADDGSIRDGLLYIRLSRAGNANGDRPQRAEVILSLDGSECSDHFRGRITPRDGELLADKAMGGDVRMLHTGIGDDYMPPIRRSGNSKIAKSYQTEL